MAAGSNDTPALVNSPGREIKHTTDAHRPVLLTSRGRGVAMDQSVAD
jgi:hypothetical protein